MGYSVWWCFSGSCFCCPKRMLVGNNYLDHTYTWLLLHVIVRPWIALYLEPCMNVVYVGLMLFWFLVYMPWSGHVSVGHGWAIVPDVVRQNLGGSWGLSTGHTSTPRLLLPVSPCGLWTAAVVDLQVQWPGHKVRILVSPQPPSQPKGICNDCYLGSITALTTVERLWGKTAQF